MKAFFGVLVFALIATVMAEKLTAPVLMWSSTKYLEDTQIIDTVVPEDLSQFLNRIALNTAADSTNKLEAALKNTNGIEVIVLFVESKMTTDSFSQVAHAYSKPRNGGAFSALQDAQVVAPYATVGAHVSLAESAATRVLSTLPLERVVIAKEPESRMFTSLGARVIAHSEIKEYISTSDMLSNGAVDVVVVCFDDTDYAAHGALIADVEDVVAKSNYIAIFTANKPASDILFSFPYADDVVVVRGSDEEVRRFAEARWVLSDSSSGSNGTGNGNGTSSGSTNYFTGPVLEMYFVVVILLVLAFTGLCMIFNVQTHDKQFHDGKQKRL